MGVFNQEILQRYIFALRDHVGGKCSLYADPTWNEEFKVEDEFWYNGFLFKNNRVYVYNIMIYSDKDWDNPTYLEITKACADLLNYYNHYHVMEIVSLILQRYARENILAENNYLHFKYYDPQFKQKRRYTCEKHRSRQSKYIESHGTEVSGLWHSILLSKAREEVFTGVFARHKLERPDSLNFPWDTRDELRKTPYE